MGLLDGLLGQVMGGMLGGGQTQMPGQSPLPGQAQSPLLMMLLQLLQQNGGLQGVLGKLQQSGYGQQAQSWIGTGQNMPIDAGALSQIFGHGQLGQIAQQLGVSQEEAAGGLAQMLPQVVDQMTPQGQVPDNHSDLVNEALAMLQRGRGT
jgi:uncharacterized protein YidB (DUF937 family)